MAFFPKKPVLISLSVLWPIPSKGAARGWRRYPVAASSVDEKRPGSAWARRRTWNARGEIHID